MTLLLLLQREEHLHQTPSPLLLLSVSCTLQAALSAEPSQAASSRAEPSCATSTELEQEGIWPCPPVATPPFSDLSCLGVYPSVCKDQAICPCPFPGCFNGALAVLVAQVGKTRVWEKWGHTCYLTEGNIKLMNTMPFLSSCDSRAVRKDLVWCSSLMKAWSLHWSEVSQGPGYQDKCNAMLFT